MNKKSFGFIGGGRITKIFLQAFQNSGKHFDKIEVFDPDIDLLMKLKKIFPNIYIENINIETAAKCDVIFLAVHPPVIIETLAKINKFIRNNSLIVSLAPKVTIEKIKSALNGFETIARVNPSAPGIINQGFNPVTFSAAVVESDKEYLLSILKILGITRVVEESKLEAYAVISAMGPTYFWFQLEYLKDLGLSYGLNEEELSEVIPEMIRGSVNTLFNSGMMPQEIMDLIPVKPIGVYEETIKEFYSEKLNAVYQKIKP